MKYNLSKPCANCPFRDDIRPYLNEARAGEIVESLEQSTFPCHKTVDYDKEGHLDMVRNSSHCAGALIMLEHVNQPSQAMRIAERLGIYDRRKLKMDAPVFRRPLDFIAAQEEL